MTTGDFDEDGHQDLAVAHVITEDVAILLGNGDGSFRLRWEYIEISLYNVSLGDFNEDGHQDLVLSGGGGDISILLGVGDGSFREQVRYRTNLNSYSVAIGDFTGDGHQDLAVADRFSYNVSILFGNGDGSFNISLSYGAGGKPFSVVLDDFNEDGLPDLAVANQESDDITILINTGLFECWDEDGDGYQDAACGGTDCDDTDPLVYPWYPESDKMGNCDDGKDNDCDGLTDTDPECTPPCSVLDLFSSNNRTIFFLIPTLALIFIVRRFIE